MIAGTFVTGGSTSHSSANQWPVKKWDTWLMQRNSLIWPSKKRLTSRYCSKHSCKGPKNKSSCLINKALRSKAWVKGRTWCHSSSRSRRIRQSFLYLWRLMTWIIVAKSPWLKIETKRKRRTCLRTMMTVMKSCLIVCKWVTVQKQWMALVALMVTNSLII